MDRQVQALVERLSVTETNVLLHKWEHEERVDWAENALRAELASRGVSEEQLSQLASRRGTVAQGGSSINETFVWFGIVSRFGAFMGAIVAAKVLGGLLGKTAGVLGAVAVIAVYVAVLVRRLSGHTGQKSTAGEAVVLALQWIEAVLLSLLVVALLVLLALEGT